MGCNCGKAKGKFQELVQKEQVKSPPIQPIRSAQPIQQKSNPQPMTRSEKIRLRGLRIEARNQRVAARNAAILAVQSSIANLRK